MRRGRMQTSPETATEAGGTHTTGMHSCFWKCLPTPILILQWFIHLYAVYHAETPRLFISPPPFPSYMGIDYGKI